jgi:hypothetical protein
MIHGATTARNAVSRHFISAQPNNGNILGQTTSLSRSVWINYAGRFDKYRSNYGGEANGDWKMSRNGIQVGSDLYRTGQDQFGLFFGYEAGKAALLRSEVKADDYYFGLYGAHIFKSGFDIQAIYSFGNQSYNMTRAEEISGTLISAYHSKLKGTTHELSFDFGRRIFLHASGQERVSFRPSLGTDLLFNNIKGGSETRISGTGTPVSYGKTDLTQAYLRIGSDWEYRRGCFTWSGGLWYFYDMNGGGLATDVVAETRHGKLSGSDLGRSILSFDIGGSWDIGACFTFFAGYNGNAHLDRAGHPFASNGYAGGAWKW